MPHNRDFQEILVKKITASYLKGFVKYSPIRVVIEFSLAGVLLDWPIASSPQALPSFDSLLSPWLESKHISICSPCDGLMNTAMLFASDDTSLGTTQWVPPKNVELLRDTRTLCGLCRRYPCSLRRL